MKKLFPLVLLLAASGCDNLFLGDEDQVIPLEENLMTPAATDDGWDVSSLASENINAAKIEQLVRNIQNDPRNLHSMLIVRNNKLVLDAYFNGWHKDRIHDQRSASKSVNSILVGIAIDRNYIQDVDQRVFQFFPEYEHLNNDQKNEIRIKHLLTMTAGLDWDQSNNSKGVNDEAVMEESKDWLRYVLGKDMAFTPGERFVYNSGCSNLLAGIIKKSTGDHSNVFAEKYLFSPLHITKYFWRRQDDGLCNAGAGLLLRPRDMAKIGQLFLDSGSWKGNQVVSRQWVKASTTAFMGQDEDYGYQWWTSTYTAGDNPVPAFSAAGNGGQYIFVVPGLNLVVVFTGGNYAPLNQGQPHGLMRNIIVPAML